MESEIVNWTIRTRLCESVKGRGEGEKEVVRRGGGGYLYGGNKAENRSVRERELDELPKETRGKSERNISSRCRKIAITAELLRCFLMRSRYLAVRGKDVRCELCLRCRRRKNVKGRTEYCVYARFKVQDLFHL